MARAFPKDTHRTLDNNWICTHPRYGHFLIALLPFAACRLLFDLQPLESRDHHHPGIAPTHRAIRHLGEPPPHPSTSDPHWLFTLVFLSNAPYNNNNNFFLAPFLAVYEIFIICSFTALGSGCCLLGVYRFRVVRNYHKTHWICFYCCRAPALPGLQLYAIPLGVEIVFFHPPHQHPAIQPPPSAAAVHRKRFGIGLSTSYRPGCLCCVAATAAPASAPGGAATAFAAVVLCRSMTCTVVQGQLKRWFIKL